MSNDGATRNGNSLPADEGPVERVVRWPVENREGLSMRRFLSWVAGAASVYVALTACGLFGGW